MQPLFYEFILAVVAGVLSWSLIGLYTRAMSARRMPAPNHRSMHRVPVPVGAGLAIVVTALILWPLWQSAAAKTHVVLLLSFAALGAMSWLDDSRPLPPLIRLGAQAIAVTLCLTLLAPQARILPVIPVAIERIALGVGWLWFINLFNFMDGIDGLAGSEAVAVALGYLLLLAYIGVDGPLWRLALIIAAASAGYLVWNWHPAKVFMGDAGSIPLGFLLGWLMIDLALRGYWPAAMILPLYFVVDATLTLVRRGLKGERPWTAHREHFYQRAVLGGTTPQGVVCRVTAANGALLLLALASVSRPLLALAAAVATVGILIINLQGLAQRAPL
jgi:UDP-N-acetylmuramyl pentapeptide phosphotransferase/UDP-N-acetylglucosamine-1-phosphate transferase